MARKYVDQIILTVQGKDLDDIILDFTEKRNRGTKAVNTMNRARRAKGFKRGNMHYSGTMKVEELDDPALPNWDEIIEKGILIKVVKKPNAGKRVTWFDLCLEDISDSYSDGDSSRTLSWMAIRRVVG